MRTTKIISTKRFKKNGKTFIGFILHQIPNYLTREHFQFTHKGITYVSKEDIKQYELLIFSKR